MKILSLVENTSARADVGAEHGLSLYIEANGYRMLFDMGQSDLFARNARMLGVDLSRVDLAILSHGHYDHGGGLSHFLTLNQNAPVYVHQKAFGGYYHGNERYIGIDPALRKSPRLRLGEGERVIGHGLTLFDCNELPRPGSLGSFGLCECVGGEYIPDRFLHEQYLLIEEEGKRVLISGCSHKGIADIVSWFEPDVLVGGFHLSKLENEPVLEGIAKQLNRHPTRYVTCHCTGALQFEFLKAHMKTLSYLSAGACLEL